MDPRRVRAVARRIAAQFRHDRRSLGLLIVAPILVLSLVGALWGTSTSTPPSVVVTTDRFAVPPNVLDAFLRSSAIRAERATYAEGMQRLRDGRTEAVVWLEPAAARMHVEIEGSNPVRSGQVGPAVQKALQDGLSVLGSLPGPRVEVTYLYGGPDHTLLDSLAPLLIGLFAFFFTFLLATVSFLRERTSGTLERLMATPLKRGELVLGYLAGFSFFALIQAIVIIAFTVLVLRVRYTGNIGTIFLIEAMLVIVSVSLGLFVSAFARTELQAIQFIPIVLVPQIFLSGLLVPVDQLPDVLRPFAVIMPLTYSNEALRAVMTRGFPLDDPLIVRDLLVLAAFGVVTIAGAIASIRREVA